MTERNRIYSAVQPHIASRNQMANDMSSAMDMLRDLLSGPDAGEKIKGKYTVKIILSKGPSTENTLVKIPDIDGMDSVKAIAKLETEEIKYQIFDEASDDVDEGKVIRTDPKNGSEIPNNTILKVYVSLGPDVIMVKVPNLINLSKADAQKQLENLGLELGQVVEVDSTYPKGYVVEQSINQGKDVAKGTKIGVTVSTGTLPIANVTVRFSLPSLNEQGYMQVFIDNTEDYSKAANVYLGGGTQSITLSGNSESTTVVVTINWQKIYEATVNFKTQAVSNEKTYPYEVPYYVPYIDWSNAASAETAIVNAGLNPKKVEEFSDTVPAGQVISISPTEGSLVKKGATVTLKVSKGPKTPSE